MTGPEALRVMHPLFHAGEGGSSPTSALKLRVVVIPFEQAKALNARWHSRLPKLGTGAIKDAGRRFLCFAATFDGIVYAVAIWSAPPARASNGKPWLELRRLAVAPDAPRNTPSRMLRVMALLIRRARPSVEKLTTKHDVDAHSGAIYRAAGWKKVGKPRRNGTAGQWDTRTRRRPAVQSDSPKQRWEKSLI